MFSWCAFMPCFLDCLSLLSCFMLPLLQVLLLRFSYLECFVTTSFMVIDVLSSLLWCIIIYPLWCFITHLVITNTSVSCARYTEKAFMLCLLCVPLYLWDTILAFSATYLVSSLWALLAFLYALLVLYCLAGTLYGCVHYTPSVIYFHTGAFMLMSDALISDLFPLWC